MGPKYIEFNKWKMMGFIGDKLPIDKQMELSENLTLGNNLIFCSIALNSDADFYHDIKLLLYPIIIHYTTLKNGIWLTKGNVIHKFIQFCEDNLRIKYNNDTYNDYELSLCQDFIKLN